MALQGTLKDFGIAEILQLIGQQAKSGVLHLKSDEDEIHILIADGSVVSAEYAGRRARERLGNLLVRADLITQAQLDLALDAQKRTLRRLGDVVVEMGMIAKDDLREMTSLQTTETVYRLFHWKSGTYDFEPGDVEWDRETVTPLRAESLLMEGFRQVDEWPMIRRKITSTAMTFERLRDLEPEPGEAEPDPLSEVGEEGGRVGKGEFASIGRSERKVYALAAAGRTVERIVDLSRLGEFEACKALLNLVNLGILRPGPPARLSVAAGVGAYARGWPQRLRRGAARLVATVAIAGVVAVVAATAADRGLLDLAPGARALREGAAQRFLGRHQLARLAGALEVYRLERGDYPESLDALVEAGLAAPRDLRYPWSDRYYYRRKVEGGFVLLPPIE